ncbi:DNA ligase 3 [Periplaneta americana]|uniref:DNA ligase 3 n=1 Tax=Periplaneta americana TaxID=6978 RepID=UPI0037E84C1B
MSDDGGEDESQQDSKKFFVDRAKSGRATCKKCKEKLNSGDLRLAKSGYNPFGPGPMKMWHHVSCLFDVFSRQRPTTAKIETPDDIEGWSDLEEEDQEEILKYLPKCKGWKPTPKEPKDDTPKKTKVSSTKTSKEKEKEKDKDKDKEKEKDKDKDRDKEKKKDSGSSAKEGHKDDSFREFRRLCAALSETQSYTGKTALVKEFFTKGTDGSSFKGDLNLWCRLLLPGAIKRVYNLQSKQLIKLFSKILHTDQDDMLEDLEQGDVAETVRVFFEKSKHLSPTKKSNLSLQDVDKFLEELSGMTKEDEQSYHFKQMAKKCTSNDLKMIIRLVKHDLRINAGPKHILEAVHPDAYQAFQTSQDLDAVLAKAVVKTESGHSSPTKKTNIKITASVMTPVLPMLAEACKSVEYAMKKCPNGMYSEIKYDGERVQVHKKGNEFKYFSRSLKPVLPHKINTFKDYIPKAFPYAKDLILDSEVLLVDVKTGKPLPFGTLGVHKKHAFKDANVCLFVFDCIYYNGEMLLEKPIKERRRILEENMEEVPNRIMFSEMEEIHAPKDLANMITKVLKLGLEGLVLKDLMSIYEPGKRHWLKVKKDYLFGGAMADSADLVVLGAWFGTGQKGGMKSVFLMGCYDPDRKKWCTVTKVHTGHDDKTLERLQDELDMIKISKEASKVPDWLLCTKTMIPDFVARDPEEMPVWEITGAEFTQHEVHTASGISIRFPRVTKIRCDKTWKTATSLPELKVLFKNSKENMDFSIPSTSYGGNDDDDTSSTSTSRGNEVDSPSSTPKKAPPQSKISSILFKNKISAASKVSNTKKHKQEPGNKTSDDESNTITPNNASDADSEANEENNNGESPAKKRKKSDSSDKMQYQINKPLPDVFGGVKLVLPDSVKENRCELERYFIAYGGELLSRSQIDECTHVIHINNSALKDDEGDTWPREARHVALRWLWDSIKLQELQEPRSYAVRKA